jgi:hypothetical protein
VALPKFLFFFLTRQLQRPLLRSKEIEKKRATNSSTRKREKEKESERKSFETSLVSLFSQLLSSFFVVGSPPILALSVGFQAPSNSYNTNRTTTVTKRN